MLRVLVAQLNPTIGAIAANTKKILDVLKRARMQRADIVLFPEMAVCGYPPEDLVVHATFITAVEKALQEIIAASEGLFVVVGLVRRNPPSGEKPLLNSAAIIENGKLLGFYDKWLLPTYDVFDERRYFEPGNTLPVWSVKGRRVVVTICEDMWGQGGLVKETQYHRDPIQELAAHPPDLLLNLAASPYHFDKPITRFKVCQSAAKKLHCYLIMACQVGGNDQLVFDGNSLCVDPQGRIRQLARSFEEDEMLVDLSALPGAVELPKDRMGDLYRALVLGLRDYFHKLGFRKACFGLSGGIDSALVACIAKDALGGENVLAVLMPSRYNPSSSQKDAELLVRNLGISQKIIPIEAPFTTFLDLLAPHFEGKPFDVTEENLQARIRGTILMALSNKLGHIVLSTGNKSEFAMGYCTLYGDMAGGLGVISDVTKDLVYSLSRWVNRNGEVIPQAILDKPPSAELRPNQKDSDSLPDYKIIDKVVESYLEEHLSAEQIAEKDQLPLELVQDLIRRIHRSEYKRRQAAPGIRVSRKSFGVGRRYPIVQHFF